MPLVKNIIKNSIALWTSQGFHSLVSICAVAIIARYLGVEQFGIYGFVLAICNIFQVMTDMGANQILVREVARQPERVEEYFTASFIIMSFFGTLVFFLITGTVYFFHPDKQILVTAAIGALAVILLFVSQLFSSVFQAFERMEYVAYMRSMGYIVYLGLVIAAVMFDGGITGIFLALLMEYILACIVGYGFTRKYFFKPRFLLNFSRVCEVLHKGWPIGLNAMLRKLTYRIDILFIKALSSLFDLGLFNGVYRVILQLQFIPRNLTSALFPVFSRFAKNDKTKLTDVHSRSVKFLFIGCVPIVTIFLVFPHAIISVVLGRKFIGAVPLMRVLALTVGLLFLSTLFIRMLNALDKQRRATFCVGVGLIVNIICDIIFIPRWGFMGAGIATLVAETVLFIMTGILVMQYLSLFPLIVASVKLLIAGSIMAIIWAGFGNKVMWLRLIVGLLSYPLLLWGFRVFDDQERHWLHSNMIKLCKVVYGK